LGRNKEIDIEMANRGYDSFSIIHINAYLDNKALHRTAIPLLSTAAGELKRYASLTHQIQGGVYGKNGCNQLLDRT
jgi:hypothetical protein